jgi:hypothetical protein
MRLLPLGLVSFMLGNAIAAPAAETLRNDTAVVSQGSLSTGAGGLAGTQVFPVMPDGRDGISQ